jgi:hypothetical protein
VHQGSLLQRKRKKSAAAVHTKTPFLFLRNIESYIIQKYGVEKGTRIIPCRWHSRGFSGSSGGGAAAARKRREQHRRCWHAAVQP